MMEIVMSGNSELMMTMEVLIYPVLGFMFLLLVFIMFGNDVHGSDHIVNVTHNVNITVDKCASEHCVRCNKYKTIMKKASTRFREDLRLRAAVADCGERMTHAIGALNANKTYESIDEQQPNVLYVDGLRPQAFWQEDEFVTDIAVLESEIGNISREFEDVYNNVWPQGWFVNNTPSGEWAVFHLINQGARVKDNCQKCPKTFELLQRLACSMSTSENLFANASFSVVQSGTHISAHYGPTNVRIRCHLGLRVSDPESSYLTVNGKHGKWETGKCLLFDDSFLHEVHHKDVEGEARAVLLIDMWHPDLTQSERDLIDNLFKYQRADHLSVPPVAIPISSDF